MATGHRSRSPMCTDSVSSYHQRVLGCRTSSAGTGAAHLPVLHAENDSGVSGVISHGLDD